jgi:hypothetical protein
MGVALVLALVSLLCFAVGVAAVAAPAWWSRRLHQSMADPMSRFLVTQGLLLAGVLLLLAAAESPRSWFWIAIGGLAAAKALVLLGLSDRRREQALSWWTGRPLWVPRLAGTVAVALATLLASDVARMLG